MEKELQNVQSADLTCHISKDVYFKLKLFRLIENHFSVNGNSVKTLFNSCLETRKWLTDLKPEGRQPEPRSFHSCVAVGSRIVVSGGRGTSDQHFQDFHVFDTSKYNLSTANEIHAQKWTFYQPKLEIHVLNLKARENALHVYIIQWSTDIIKYAKNLCELNRMCELSTHQCEWGSMQLCELTRMCELSRGHTIRAQLYI